MNRIWICPHCGRETCRAKERSRRCICGSMMEPAVEKAKIKKVLEKMED